MKLQLLSLVTGFLLIVGCSKKDDPSRKEVIARSWKITAYTADPGVNSNGVQVTDIYAQQANCNKDDLIIFASSGTYQQEEGATRCRDNDPQIYATGTWTLSSDEKTLILTQAASSTPVNYEIVEASTSQLKVKVTQDEQDGLRRTRTLTYVAQ